MPHNLEFSSLLQYFDDPYSFLNYAQNKMCDTLLERA